MELEVGHGRGELRSRLERPVEVDAVRSERAGQGDPVPVDQLAELLRLAQEASERFATEENLEVAWERIWNIEPILFDPALIDLCDDACRAVAGTSHRLPSGPLHDAAEVARAGVPTVMLFVQSLRGLSHTKLEDTRDEHLELAVAALDRLADSTIARVSSDR